MASTRPGPSAGIRTPIGCLLLCLCAAGCTTPNPNFVVGKDAPVEAGGQGGGAGGAGGIPGSGGIWGTGGLPGGGGTWGTGGLSGAGGTPSPDTATDPVAAGDGETSESGGPADAAPPTDSGAPETGAPSAVCNTQTFDPATIVGARGIAIDTAGVVFYTREVGSQAWIGRLVPGEAAQPSWLALASNAQPRALRLDSQRALLFVAASGANAVYAVNTGFTIGGRVAGTLTNLPGAHGLAVAEDGALLVSLSNGLVMHLVIDLAQSPRTPTTTTAIFPASQRPLGLAFGPAGHLFVGSSDGGIKRFVFRDKLLIEGTDHGQWTGSANDLAFDVDGRLYVADSTASTVRHVTVLPATGAGVATTIGSAGMLSGLAFGRGALACQDLYVTDSAGPARRLNTTALGLKLP